MLREKLLLAVAAKVRALHDEQRHDKRLPENGVASRGFEDRFLSVSRSCTATPIPRVRSRLRGGCE